jgi:2-haloacid dehalogenase
MPALRPAVVAFDVNETLFSLDAIGEAFADAGLGSDSVKVWFARILRDGIALSVTGDYRPFGDLAATHLNGLLRDAGRDGDAELVLDVLGRFRRLRAYPDAEPAFERLRDAGVRIVTLTNGHAETVQAMLDHAGLAALVEASLSVDDAGHWKPRPEPYRYAADRCGVDLSAMAMVAVHSWDVHGAKRAGLTTGYSTRLEGTFVEGFTPPDVTGASLLEVVDGLLALPSA